MQAANIEAETSGIPFGEFQLTRHEFSSLGRGKFSGTCLIFASAPLVYLQLILHLSIFLIIALL